MDTDEHPRPDVTIEALGKLPTVFKKGGTVTAGNASVSPLSVCLTICPFIRPSVFPFVIVSAWPVYQVVWLSVSLMKDRSNKVTLQVNKQAAYQF